MATADEIAAAVETAQATTGEALQQLVSDTGLTLESVELVDGTTEPPTVKIKVALGGEEEVAEEAPAAPKTIDEHFGV